MHNAGSSRQPWAPWAVFALIVLVGSWASALAADDEAPPTSTDGATTPAGGEEGNKVVVGANGSDVIAELHIKDLELAAALRMLTMQTKDNVILSAKVNGQQKVEANLYNVTFEQVLQSILTPLALVYKREGNFIYIYTRKEMEEIAAETRTASSAVFKLNYINAADASALIKPLLSQIGQVAVTAAAASGIESGTTGTGGNTYSTQDALVVTDYEENIRQIGRVVKELDVRPRQVLIEATILRATLNEDNALGVDFNTLGGIDFASLTAASTGEGEGEGSDTTTTLAQYPGNSLSVDGNLARSAFDQTTFNVKTDFLDPALFPRGGFSFGIIKNNIAAFIRALEEVTDTTVVANPKVLALNKQKGEVIVGRRDGYLTTVTTETESVQKVEFLETGVQLIFRPYIGKDGYVRMELHPEDSSGALTAANLPFEETTEVTTNLLVKDGHTIVIGGLFREQTRSSRAQVPWLGNIPYAGVLFRRKRDNTVREEVVILLTVHIIEDNEEYSKDGEEVLEDVERIRVGLRQSLMPHGRERLAQSHYKRALELVRTGQTDKALWEVNMALHLHPRFLDAIKLKEELTNQRAWEGNSSMVRNYIYNRVIGAENVWRDTLGEPPAGPLQPAPDAGSPEWGTPERKFGVGPVGNHPTTGEAKFVGQRSPKTGEGTTGDDGQGGQPLPQGEAPGSNGTFQMTPPKPAEQEVIKSPPAPAADDAAPAADDSAPTPGAKAPEPDSDSVEVSAPVPVSAAPTPTTQPDASAATGSVEELDDVLSAVGAE